MSDVIHIASCPEHGLHGQRSTCFACDGPVNQVPLLPLMAVVEPVQRAAETLATLNVALNAMGEARGHLTPGMRAGTAEAVAILDRAQTKIRQRLAQAEIA